MRRNYIPSEMDVSASVSDVLKYMQRLVGAWTSSLGSITLSLSLAHSLSLAFSLMDSHNSTNVCVLFT